MKINFSLFLVLFCLVITNSCIKKDTSHRKSLIIEPDSNTNIHNSLKYTPPTCSISNNSTSCTISNFSIEDYFYDYSEINKKNLKLRFITDRNDKINFIFENFVSKSANFISTEKTSPLVNEVFIEFDGNKYSDWNNKFRLISGNFHNKEKGDIFLKFNEVNRELVIEFCNVNFTYNTNNTHYISGKFTCFLP